VAVASSATRRGNVVTMANPFEFIQEVRQEVAKVTWPSRKEVMITTAMVLVMVVMASMFFLFVDQLISWGVSQIFSLSRR
jgi:preprotein translocase subunit SecE